MRRWRPALARAALALLLCGSGWHVAQAQTPPEASKQPFTLEVVAPAPLNDFVRRHAELQRFQALDDLTPQELERLLATAPDNIRRLLGTQGYFAPRVQVQLLPATQDNVPPVVQVTVEPGARTQVAKVAIGLQGEVRDNPASAEQRAAVQGEWALPVGEPFTQAAWDTAKNQALRSLANRVYPRARITNSLADIDPERHEAHLNVDLDSGPAYAFGDIAVEGAQRYDPDMARRLTRLAGVRRGAPYDEAVLQAAQQRLVDSGYYASAFVMVDETDTPQDAPVQVRVREARLQKLVLGVGASTDNGPRLSLEHTHLNVPGLHWRADTNLKLERDASTLGTQLQSPVDDQGWHWVTGVQLQRVQDDPSVTHSQQWRVGQAQNGAELDRSFFLQYDRSRITDPGLPDADAESSISANYAWTRRRFDDITFPRRGHGLAVELGAGVTLSQERQPYLRAKARWLGYWPVASDSTRPSRLALRLEGGAIWARNNAPVPATQRFLAGGDQSVRGYGPREIGIPLASGGVDPGRLLTVASLEWQRPIWVDGKRSPWEAALFVDAGAVGDTAKDLDPKVGIGAGVRYRSPVGPLQLDLAYGLDKKQLRLHLSVGFAF